MDTVLIFDYDGVIVDSLDMFMDFFLKACQNHGWTQISSKETFLDLFQGNMYEHMMKLGMGRQDILNIVLEVKQGLLAHLDELSVFPKMKSTLETLAEHHILVVSTSNDTEVVKRFLEMHKMSWFDQVYGSDIHPSKIKKIEFIKNHYPQKTYVYIGDTIGDIIEGKKAGIKTIGVTWGWHTKHQLQQHHPDLLVESVSDLLTVGSRIA